MHQVAAKGDDSFLLHCRERDFVLRADSGTVRDAWVRAIVPVQQRAEVLRKAEGALKVKKVSLVLW